MSLLFSYRMPDKGKKLPYDECQVIAAIASVKNGSSFNAAAIKHGVPLSTLRDRLGRLKRRRFVKLSSLFKRFEIEVSSSVQAVKQCNILKTKR